MSDVSYDDNGADDGFDAEMNEARQAQEQDDAGHDEGAGDDDGQGEQQEEKPAVSKDVEKLERVAADKSRMAHAERTRRQAAEARAEALEARLAALERGGGRQDDDIDLSAIPDVDTDPLANIEALRKIALRLTQQEQAKTRQTEAQTAQQRQFQQINTRMQEYEADFSAENPDYNDAAAHFRTARMAELQEQGYEGEELNTALRTELVGLVARSLQSGKDPAEVVYRLAKNRGFGVKTGKENPEQVDKPNKKLETIERGQKASRSLSGMSGKTGDGELSAASVSRLEGAAFDAAFAKLRQEARRAG